MATTATEWFDDDFESRLDQIALPIDHARPGPARSLPGTISLTLLAVGIGLALIFFVAGFVLLIFCIGWLVWYAGAAIVLVIAAFGAALGLVAIFLNLRQPVQLTIGCIGFALNGALAAACLFVIYGLYR